MATLFGKEIQIKTLGCNRINIPGRPIMPGVMLFVKTTDSCNAHCLFCSNAGCREEHRPFDSGKLLEVIDEIERQHIHLTRINFTGGEPSLVADRVVLPLLEQLSAERYRHLWLHLNTNGVLPQSQRLMQHPRWNSVSVSLHHYDRDRLTGLYGLRKKLPVPCFDGVDKDRVVLNASCNLIKGYIDNAEEVRKMMDYVLELGLRTLGFVALMKTNDFCSEHFVDFTEIEWEQIPHLYYTGSRNRGTDCKCSNYLYNNGHDVLDVYMRNYANFRYCESSLLFDGSFLRQGFHDDNVIY